VAAAFLDDFARELRQIGEVGFRRRHVAPVLIVTGRAAKPGSKGPEGATHRTGISHQGAALALIHRVFPIVKAAHARSGPVSVGRTSENDVVIPEYSISKRHCTFELGEGTMAIRDAGSTNGTLLNGSPLGADAPVPLCGGETITMGRFKLVYETPAGFLELVSGLVK
jgi:FHA domain